MKSFDCIVDGVPKVEKAVSYEALMGMVQAMGYEANDYKVIREIPSATPVDTSEHVTPSPPPPPTPPPPSPRHFQPPPQQQTLEWVDGDSEYKLEGGVLYKKVWRRSTIRNLLSRGIRIKIKNENEETLKAKEYSIEIQEWDELSIK